MHNTLEVVRRNTDRLVRPSVLSSLVTRKTNRRLERVSDFPAVPFEGLDRGVVEHVKLCFVGDLDFGFRGLVTCLLAACLHVLLELLEEALPNLLAGGLVEPVVMDYY